MTQHHGMDELTATGEDESFAALRTRLVDDYGKAREAEIDRMVEQERRRLSDAEIRSFLPVLVERHVRDELG
jgi:hypothetical protein